jgi:hypothetical protein
VWVFIHDYTSYLFRGVDNNQQYYLFKSKRSVPWSSIVSKKQLNILSFSRSVSEIAFLIMGRPSIFIMSFAIFIQSFGLVIAFFTVFGETAA